MTHVEFSLAGIPQMDRALEASVGHALVAVGGALYREANSIIVDAKDETPVHWGTMRASGGVQLPQLSADGVEVVLGFGGASQAYDVIQHEIPMRHRVGKDHFLSDPFNAHAVGMDVRLAAEIASTPFFVGLP